MKIKCIVVDDQQHSVELLVDHISKTPFLELNLATTDPIEALNFLDQKKIDCIFLDVEMPNFNGIDFLEALRSKHGLLIPKIILTTGYSDYALSGYDYGVFDYILKPLTYKRFKLTTDRLFLEFKSKEPSSDDNNFFFAESDGKKVKINFSDIVYIEGAGNYIFIVTKTKKLIFYKTMNALTEILPEKKFIRVHKSYIISFEHIEAIKGNEILVSLNNITKNIPIGITYKEALSKALKINN